MSELVANRTESVLPTMQTRRVRLRRIADGDGAFLYNLMTSLTAGGRVRYGGATPSPEKVLQGMWESVLAQFIIEGTSSQARMGVVAITSVNFRDGFAYFSVLGTEAARGRGLLGEGTFLGLHYAFSTWPFRKIYMEASDASIPAFEGALDRYFVEEGRLRQHTVLERVVRGRSPARRVPRDLDRARAAIPGASRESARRGQARRGTRSMTRRH